MTADPPEAVRECLSLLQHHLILLDGIIVGEGGEALDGAVFRQLAGDIYRAVGLCPRSMPPFDEVIFANPAGPGLRSYNAPAVRRYLASAITQLGGQPPPAPTGAGQPLTPRAFTFVRDPALRAVLERDYVEMLRVQQARAWKAAIVLAGGVLEGILVDLIGRHADRARKARRAPEEADIARWNLGDLINVALELRLVTQAVDRLSHAVRMYRNLIHPAHEVRARVTFGEEEARIAVEVIHVLWRDLGGPAAS